MNMLKQILITLTIILFFFVCGFTQSILFEEQFNGSLNGWTVESNYCTDISDPDPNNWVVDSTCTTALWKFSSTGEGAGRFWAEQPFASTTAANGCVLFDSDFLDTNGLDSFGTGLAPAGRNSSGATVLGHSGTIISPVIDLTNGGTVSPSSVVLRFSQYYQGAFTSLDFSYSISSDGGTTWDSTSINVGYLPTQVSDNPHLYSKDVTSLVSPDLTNVRIKFTFSGAFNYWMLDDIIFSEPLTSNTGIDNDYKGLPANYGTPISQVEPIILGARVQNKGTDAQTNVKLKAEITRGATLEFADSITISTLVSGTDSILRLPNNFTPSSIGTYNLKYTVSQDNIDQEAADNVANESFVVNSNRFIKAAPGALAGARPGPSYAVANHFRTSSFGNLIADSVYFSITNYDSLIAAGESLDINIYKWDDTNGSGFISAPELTGVGFGTYTPSVGVGNSEYVGVAIFDLLTTNAGVALLNNSDYIISVNHTGQADFFMNFNLSRNHMALIDFTREAGSPHFVSPVYLNQWFSLGFGAEFAAAIQLSVDQSTAANDIDIREDQISVFPNPAQNEISVKLDLQKNAQEVYLSISDISGKVLFDIVRKSVKTDVVNINLAGLVNGTYNMTIRTADSVKNISFIKH